MMPELAGPRPRFPAPRGRVGGAVVALAVLALSCDSPLTRLLAWLLVPERVAIRGEHDIEVASLHVPVSVWFDRWAVPHVDAPDEASMAFALGYLHGRDRRFQLELFRLAAAGRLREMLGDGGGAAVLRELDLQGRAVGLARIGAEWLQLATPADRAMLEAYAAGINEATARESVGVEFRMLDWQPQPWQPLDTMSLLALISFGLAKNWPLELARLELAAHQLRNGGSVERALQIWPPRCDLPPHLIAARGADPFAGVPSLAPELEAYLRDWAQRVGPSRLAPGGADVPTKARDEAPAPIPGGGGSSNNWALGGAWTGTGKGALGADPHMLHAMPPMGYLAHLRCGSAAGGRGYEIIGGGFVGLPALPFATNGKVAWGVTANWADVTDLWVERDDVATTTREEVFRIRDAAGMRTETRRIRATARGVIVNDFVDRLPPEFPLVALRWSAGTGALGALRGLYRAESAPAARVALQGFDALVGHWALADAGGDIAYAMTACLPRRPRSLGVMPSPGWLADYAWAGSVAAAELPWVENPAAGFVATANQQVVDPAATGFVLDFDGDVAFRAQRIAEVLAAGRGVRSVVPVITSLQRDPVDRGREQLLPLLRAPIAALQHDADPRVALAARLFLGWDGRVTPDCVAVTVEQSLCAHLLQRVLEDEMAPSTLAFVLGFEHIEPFVYGVLGDADNPAWDDGRTPARESAGDVVRDVFRATCVALAKRYGVDAHTWTWSRAAPFVLTHPLDRSRWLAPMLSRGPLPPRGTTNTVFKHQFARTQLDHFAVLHGPVLRVAIDLADLGQSRMSIPGGQSGRPLSPHYDDILRLWSDGDGVPMTIGFADIAARSIGRLVLR